MRYFSFDGSWTVDQAPNMWQTFNTMFRYLSIFFLSTIFFILNNLSIVPYEWYRQKWGKSNRWLSIRNGLVTDDWSNEDPEKKSNVARAAKTSEEKKDELQMQSKHSQKKE